MARLLLWMPPLLLAAVPLARFCRCILTLVYGLVCLLFVGVGASSVAAAEQRQQQPEKPTLTAAIFNYLPYGFENSEGSQVGVFIDFIHILTAESGQEIDIQLLAFPRAVRAMNMGRVDLLISYRDPIMNPTGDFIGDFGCARELLVPSPDVDLDAFTDNQKLIIAHPASGYFAGQYSTRIEGRTIPAYRSEQLLYLLSSKRVNAIAISDWVLQSLGQNPRQFGPLTQRLPQKLAHGTPLMLKKFAVSLSGNKAKLGIDLRDKLDTAFTSARKKGLFRQALAHYGIETKSCD